ncbi:MASE1 domain-containing protein [Nocardia crassostreae]|uniref:MASE1 domain-containing protein n=1 Tax=Nocardia crassostreae TaxID=53428 RepID=UPI0008301A57|nr:MASE1 domain-containing protein [Nocardia crassostreae]
MQPDLPWRVCSYCFHVSVRRRILSALWIPGVAAAYFAAAQIGLQLALVGHQVTPLWPPTGIALACLLLRGPWIWPGITLGAFATNLLLGPSPLAVVVIALGNTAAPVCAYLLVRRAGFRDRIDRFRDALILVFLGALGGMLISATVGTVTRAVAIGSWQDAWATWWVWWTGDAMGVLTITPLLLLVRRARISKSIDLFRAAEAAALVVGTLLAVALPALSTTQLSYVAVFPFLIWAGVRFHLAGAVPCAVLASFAATFAASRNLPVFADLGLTARMVNLQLFNATVILTALLHATVIAQRDRASRAVDEACGQLARALSALDERGAVNESTIRIVNRFLSSRPRPEDRPG